MSYTADDIQRLYAWAYNGGPWKADTAADADMPKSASNPAHRNTEYAEMADLAIANKACGHLLWRNGAALVACYGNDLEPSRAALKLSIGLESLTKILEDDTNMLVKAMNSAAFRRECRDAA